MSHNKNEIEVCAANLHRLSTSTLNLPSTMSALRTEFSKASSLAIQELNDSYRRWYHREYQYMSSIADDGIQVKSYLWKISENRLLMYMKILHKLPDNYRLPVDMASESSYLNMLKIDCLTANTSFEEVSHNAIYDHLSLRFSEKDIEAKGEDFYPSIATYLMRGYRVEISSKSTVLELVFSSVGFLRSSIYHKGFVIHRTLFKVVDTSHIKELHYMHLRELEKPARFLRSPVYADVSHTITITVQHEVDRLLQKARI